MEDNGGKWRGEMEAHVGEHERRIGAVEASVKEHPGLCPLTATVRDHEDRLRSVERWRWQVVGAVVFVNALGVGAILTAMYRWVKP